MRPLALPQRKDVQLLIEVLADARRAGSLDLSQWDKTVRLARNAELLAVLDDRIRTVDAGARIPPCVAAHLLGSRTIATHRRQIGLHLVDSIGRLLGGHGFSPVLLKGAGYIAQGLPMSRGRLFDDIDILVPRPELDAVEKLLMAQGWKTEKPDPYDQRYYREWSHELPPMRHPDFAMQLDVHHTIVPVTSRGNPDPARLFRNAIPGGRAPWLVLSPEDQVLHASAHLFLDSDCTNRLRELIDIDGLVRAHQTRTNFWGAIVDGAEAHGLGRYFWYAMRFVTSWLNTPVPDDLFARMRPFEPPYAVRRLIERATSTSILPFDPDGHPDTARTLSHRMMTIRAALLRMPLPLLAYHAMHKAIRQKAVRESKQPNAPRDHSPPPGRPSPPPGQRTESGTS